MIGCEKYAGKGDDSKGTNTTGSTGGSKEDSSGSGTVPTRACCRAFNATCISCQKN